MGSLRREFKPVAHMTPAEWERLHERAKEVLESTKGLEESIRERERIALWWNEQDALVGLVTVDLRHEHFQGKEVVAIYTGNVWFHNDYRGKNLVQLFAIRCMGETLLRWPRAHRYWFFGSNNYKSYLLLARNMVDFWPKRGVTVPSWERDYLLHLAQAIYKTAVDPQTFVNQREGARAFQGDETKVAAGLENDPDLQFFVHNNPGYQAGDRMMCLASLSFRTLVKTYSRATKRAFGLKNKNS